MRPRDDRGGVALLTALLAVVLVASASLAVDLGMQRVVRSDMQALADVVALDAARLLDGRTAGEVRAGTAGQPALADVVAASAARNDTTLGDVVGVSAELVSTTVDTHGALVPVRDAQGDVLAVPDADVPDAVWVTAVGEVDFAFTTGAGGATRTALANSSPSACFRLGTWAASVDPGNSSDPESARLIEMLGAELGVTALGYHGLADSHVSLYDLALELGAGSAEELVALENVRLRDLFSATARVLTAGGGDAADVTLLQSLATSARSELDATVDLADLLTVGSASGSALSGEINVLDVVASATYATDGDHFVDMGNLWSVPKFSQGDQRLTIVERPRGACGAPSPDTRAETAQLRLTSNPKLATSSLSLSHGDPTASLDIFLAGASGTLASVTCGDASISSPESMDVTVTRELSHANLDIDIPLHGEMKLSDLDLLNLPDLLALFGLTVLPGTNAKATLDLVVDAGTSLTTSDFGGTATYAVPPRTYDDVEVVGDPTTPLLPSVTIESTDIRGTITYNGRTLDISSTEVASRIDLGDLVQEITDEIADPAINDFIAKVNAELAPVAALLGLRLNGVDLLGLRRPTCDNPALRG